jgi:hypothetical protein
MPNEPAQFVFDRGQLGGPAGLLAFVISASTGDGATLTAQVLAQAKAQLWHLGMGGLQAVQTIVEKRATFACTPGLQRPGAEVAPASGPAATTSPDPIPRRWKAPCAQGWKAAFAFGTCTESIASRRCCYRTKGFRHFSP